MYSSKIKQKNLKVIDTLHILSGHVTPESCLKTSSRVVQHSWVYLIEVWRWVKYQLFAQTNKLSSLTFTLGKLHSLPHCLLVIHLMTPMMAPMMTPMPMFTVVTSVTKHLLAILPHLVIVSSSMTCMSCMSIVGIMGSLSSTKLLLCITTKIGRK